jgi:DNA polymerase-4
VFVPPDFESYTEASRDLRAVLDSFTPRVEPISLDEAFCDVSGAHTLYGSSEEIAHAIRSRVRNDLGLDASVGGGPSKLVAKVASRTCKPDGVLLVDDPIAFLHPMAIEELWGVGTVTATALRRLGVRTIGELADLPKDVLRHQLGTAAANHLHEVAWGRDPSPVVGRAANKSVGAEETFERDLDDDDEMGAELLRLSDRVASRLTEAHTRARTITVKIRLADFETVTRSATLTAPTSDAWTIFRTARDAFASFRRGRRSVRLLGVSASGLVTGPLPEQLSLEPKPRYEQGQEALSKVRERFGREALGFARILDDREGRGGALG